MLVSVLKKHEVQISTDVQSGIMAVPWSKTEDGYEIQFGTNHVGHALLTKLLLPTLLKTAEEPNSDVRVINVSSEGHMLAPGIIYDQDTLESYQTWRRYGQSKLANIFHARELQRRYPQITATSLHPGVSQFLAIYPQHDPIAHALTNVFCLGHCNRPVCFAAKVQSDHEDWAATHEDILH